MARLVQVVLTDAAAELAAAALRDAANSEDITVDEADILYDQSLLFQLASEEPAKFPLTGAKAAALSRKVRAGAKGPAQPKGRKNKRKARQEKRIGWNKQRRKLRKEMAENYNAAVATMEAEAKEMEVYEAEQAAKFADMPKFDIFSLDGQPIIRGVPESMIRPVEPEPADDPATGIVLP